MRVETVIVGAGQAGLALSRSLTAAGRAHVVLERGRVGERWRRTSTEGNRGLGNISPCEASMEVVTSMTSSDAST